MTNTVNSATFSRKNPRHANALGSDCMLDEYRIDSILGAGGFGLTYKAWDTHLQNWVAIKEYFPVEWSFRDPDGVTVHPNTQGARANDKGDRQTSDYLWGLERFLDEARALARIHHPYVIRIKRYFRAHGTAYIVMDYEEGEPLNAILQDGETLGEDEVRGLLEDVLPALWAVHEQGYLHRDIKPSNLYIRASDHRVVLIDFGAARETIGRHSKSVTSLVTPGYSPPEQYTTCNERYGPWTDIYALGAVLYRCVTGHPPLEATERLLDDRMEPASRACAGRYGANLLRAIDRALAVRAEQRFQAVTEMQAALSDDQDESSDDTVILGPWVKPGGNLIRELEAFQPTEPPPTAIREPVVDRTPLLITQSAVADGQAASQRQNELRPSPHGGASSRRSPMLLVGGGLAAALAVATASIWLWPDTPTPEKQPLSSHSLGQPEQPATMPAMSPPTSAGPAPATTPIPPSPAPIPDSTAAGTPSGGPSVTPPATFLPSPVAGLPPPLEKTPAAQTTPAEPPTALEPAALPPSAGTNMQPAPPLEAGEPTTQPGSTQPPVAGSAPEPNDGTTTGSPTPKAASTAKPSTPTPRSGSANKSAASRPTAAKSRDRSSASPVQSRAARRQASKTRTPSQSGVTQPAIRVIERKPVSTPTVRNPWEPPAATGFNQQ